MIGLGRDFVKKTSLKVAVSCVSADFLKPPLQLLTIFFWGRRFHR
jgi:hypothetical protein